MVLSKYKLPNGNVFIWLGTGGVWGESEGLDNVLILAGGDILFLKTAKVLSLYQEKVRADVESLGHKEFAAKYEFPIDYDLWKELKESAKTGAYPPFSQNARDRIADFQNMISAYISNIQQVKDQYEEVRQLEAIIHECRNHIVKIRAESRH